MSSQSVFAANHPVISQPGIDRSASTGGTWDLSPAALKVAIFGLAFGFVYLVVTAAWVLSGIARYQNCW